MANTITNVASNIAVNASIHMMVYLWEPHPDAPGEWEVLGQYASDDEAMAEALADAPDSVAASVEHDNDGFARIYILENAD